MPTRRTSGFTLIEVLVAVIILAVAAAMAGQFASTSMGRGATGSLAVNNEILLRNALEDVTIHYKAQIAADTLSLTEVASYVNTNYPSLVNDAYTGYLTFSDTDGDGTYTASAITDTYASGRMLLVTLTRGEQSLGAMFSE